MCGPCLAFYMVMKIRTQVLILVQQTLNPQSHLQGHIIYFLFKDKVLLCSFGKPGTHCAAYIDTPSPIGDLFLYLILQYSGITRLGDHK